MIRPLLSLLAALALAWLPNMAQAEDSDLLKTIQSLGAELTAEEAEHVNKYAAAEGDYSWPTVQVEEEQGYTANSDTGTAATVDTTGKSMQAIIIEKVDAAVDTNGSWRTDNLWILIAAFLVFIMHLGFATLESGLTQSKNTVNILFKNTFIVCIGLLAYALWGFNAMYPGDRSADLAAWNGFFALGSAMTSVGDWQGDLSTYVSNMTSEYAGYTWWTDFLFQGMFAATAATIISGCVAERIKLLPFLVFASIYVFFLYPLIGSWHWGTGWLAERGFYDFAGSTLVHSVGGWGGLAAILVLGARKGKYVDGQIRPILPSNLPLAAVGVFLLWFGWFGFNGGSVLDASPEMISYVCMTTSIAAALGGITAGIVSWVFGKKPDLTMALNGILAGLVGITAAPDTSVAMTIFVGISSGIIVYFAVLLFDKLKIDDPVGALSVHLVCGIWGTIWAGAVGGHYDTQIIGIIAVGAVSFTFALVSALIVKAIFGFRVSEEVETEGLDVHEHGVGAYEIAAA